MADRFGEPPVLARNLLYVMTLRTLSAKSRVQSIAAEDGVAVIRMKEPGVLPKEMLESTVPKGVQVGRTLVRIELGDGWRERLQTTLEHLAALESSEVPARLET